MVYATIVIEMSKAGLHCICDDIEDDVFCIDDNLDPLVDLINRAEELCNPDVTFSLTEKGMAEYERLKKEGEI